MLQSPTPAERAPGEPDVDFDQVDPAHRFDRVQLENRGTTSHRPKLSQGSLFARELVFHESILAKLRSIGREDLSEQIDDCHTESSVRRCLGCKRSSVFWNRCDKFWCVLCAPRLSRERREGVEWWVKQLDQPKHVVLTVRNTATISKDYVKWFKDCFARLRRRHVWSLVRGGFYRLETTNESRGWHLHIHILADARWIDARLLAQEWGQLVGQDFAIVCVKDARNKGGTIGGDYIKEVTKYVVKGDQLASWSPNQIADFVDAFTGVRTFGVFGNLYAKRTEWKEWIKSLRSGRVQCECGCDQFEILSHDMWQWDELTNESTTAIPPPKPVRANLDAGQLQLLQFTPSYPA